jgi:hypothetical protein
MSDTIKCPKCQLLVSVPNFDVKVFNDPDISIMTAIHPEGAECSCGTYLKPAIVALPPGIFSWMPAERPPDASRIISPLSLVN